MKPVHFKCGGVNGLPAVRAAHRIGRFYFFLKQGPPTDLPGSHTDLSTALGTVMKPGNSIEPRKNKKVRERQKQSGLRLV